MDVNTSKQSSQEERDGSSSMKKREDFNPYMNAAISCAIAGISNNHGGPFGACLVKNGIIMAVSHNTVLSCNDATNHAEMECIRQGCKLLRSHDLSECELYANCEPCPMCWGAINWSRLRKVFIGADRTVAAKYGFDDALFYEQLNLPYEQRRIGMTRGIKHKEILQDLFQKAWTYKRRLCSGNSELAELYKKIFLDDESNWVSEEISETHNSLMDEAINAAKTGVAKGESKEREPFGAVVVRYGEVISRAWNTVLKDNDPTATAEINAIRKASEALGAWSLSGCDIYTTTEPDIMSLGAIYWARLDNVYIGVSQKVAAAHGFEDGLLHYKELQMLAHSRVVENKHGIMADECEMVFKMWQELNGKVY